MGILTRARVRDPSLGYATDVIEMIGRELPRISEQGVRVVTNAGGVNPEAAATALESFAQEAGVRARVAWIDGDDLTARTEELRMLGLTEMSDGSPLSPSPLSFNAYLGARPIAEALNAGADIVVTGRCVDSALALGPLIHEFEWSPCRLDALSQGSLAGHLLECGPQATGGLLTDWEDIEAWDELGYPLAECRADGSFILTKPNGTGGLVDVRSAAEQLLYEIGDPAAYVLPDVTCDWRYVQLAEVGPNRVEVTGARGSGPPRTLKACAQVLDGHKVIGLVFIGGREAARKAERLGRDFIRRADKLLERDGFGVLRESDVEILGAESTYGPHSSAFGTREVVLKIALHHDSPEALGAVVRELGSFGLAVPGLTAGGRGLPKPTPLIRLHSYLVARELVTPRIHFNREVIEHHEPTVLPGRSKAEQVDAPRSAFGVEDPVELPLIAIAHGRSGDKGADANVGIRARHRDFVAILRDQVTADRVGDWLSHRIDGPVERHELPGIDAFNFVLRNALGGGGIASLRFDPQGKAYAQQLLDMPVSVPSAWLARTDLADIPEVARLRQKIDDNASGDEGLEGGATRSSSF